MRTREWLVEKYGGPAANVVIENKKQLQAQRSSEFDPCWVMRNPDLPDSEDTWLFSTNKKKIYINISKVINIFYFH